MKFEDIYNYTLIAVGTVMVASEVYKLYQHEQDRIAKDAAENWGLEAGARFNAMVKYAKQNRITKEGYVEALNAAKNVLSFEVYEVLPNNLFGPDVLRKLLTQIDKEIASVK